jgi:hypothetical protein
MPPRLALLLVLLLCSELSQAQVRQQLNDELLKHTRILRNFYSGQKLRFDSNGTLLSGGTPGYGPLDGQIYVEEVRVETNRLLLRGERPISVLNPATGDTTLLGLHQKIEISAELPSDQPTGEIADALLDKIFLTTSETNDLDCTTEEARAFRERMLRSKETVSVAKGGVKNDQEHHQLCFPGGARANVVAEGIEPPKPLKAPAPGYPVTKMQQPEDHTVVLAIIVDPNGKPSCLVAIGPPTVFDIVAIEAVQGWKYQAASEHGRPIAVAITVEVNFSSR